MTDSDGAGEGDSTSPPLCSDACYLGSVPGPRRKEEVPPPCCHCDWNGWVTCPDWLLRVTQRGWPRVRAGGTEAGLGVSGDIVVVMGTL